MEQQTTNGAILVEATNVTKHFPVRSGVLQRVTGWVRAVDDVTFFVKRGETLGLVGESGCGKTTLGRTILRLIEPTSGTIAFEGQPVTGLQGEALKHARRDMQIIFQDPFSSLDPRLTIGESISEGLDIHGIGNPVERRQHVEEALVA